MLVHLPRAAPADRPRGVRASLLPRALAPAAPTRPARAPKKNIKDDAGVWGDGTHDKLKMLLPCALAPGA